jgi:hypothetical protein
MDDICRKTSIPRKWLRHSVTNLFSLFAFTFETYSFVGLILVIKVAVIQFPKARACSRDFYKHLMQLLFLAIHCIPKSMSAKYLKIGEAWEKIKPIILIIVS